MATTSSMLDALRRELAGAELSPDGEDQLSQSVFRQLLELIVSLEYEPGQIVSQSELIERTGGSRSALRQAVTALSDLGLLRTLPRKGFMIAALDVLDVSAVYDARWAIESRLARFAALRATEGQIESLRELVRAKSVDPDTEAVAAEFVERDQALHLAIASAARNRFLEDALTRILPVSARLWHRLYRELGPDQQFMFEHHDIIQAISRRDPDAAVQAVANHLQAARDVLASVFLPVSEVGDR